MLTTGQEPRALETQAYYLGARGFLKKPLSLATLKAAMHTIG